MVSNKIRRRNNTKEIILKEIINKIFELFPKIEGENTTEQISFIKKTSI